jgi:hypothetical protein
MLPLRRTQSTFKCTHAHTHTHTPSLTHALSLSLPLALHTCARAREYTCAHPPTHTHTHTHTLTLTHHTTGYRKVLSRSQRNRARKKVRGLYQAPDPENPAARHVVVAGRHTDIKREIALRIRSTRSRARAHAHAPAHAHSHAHSYAHIHAQTQQRRGTSCPHELKEEGDPKCRSQ